MFIIVGLGNPGERYALTRHNAGRIILEKALEKLGLPTLIKSAKSSGQIAEGTIEGKSVTIFFPDSYMNESGRSVRQFLSDEANSLIVVYDDLAIPLGEFKLSFGRGDGGHNGLSSVIAATGTKDFVRIRIGIAPRTWWGKMVRPKGDKMSAYVLGAFTRRELQKLASINEDVVEALKLIVSKGPTIAMNHFN